MRNLTFRGYAQNKGFNPQQVPDETWKLESETNRTLRGMQEVRDQNRENRRDQLQALSQNFAKEEQQRNTNFNLASDFRKAYQKAELQHYEVEIQNARTRELEAQRDYQQLEKIKHLAGSAWKAYTGFQEQRVGKILSEGAYYTTEALSIFKDQEGGIARARQVLEDGLKKGVKAGEALKEVYTNPVIQKQINDMFKGWRDYSIHKHLIEDGLKDGGGLSNYIKSLDRVRLPGKKISYNELKEDDTLLDGSELHGHNATARKYLTQQMLNGGYSPGFISNVLNPQLDTFFGDRRKEVNDLVKKNLDKHLLDVDFKNAEAFIRNYKDGTGIAEYPATAQSAQARSAKWGITEKVVSKGIEEQRYDRAWLDNAYNTPVMFNGKETKLGKWREKEFETWYNKLDTVETANRLAQDKRDENTAEALKQELFKKQQLYANTDRKLAKEDYDSLYAIAQSRGMNKADYDKYLGFLKDDQNRERPSIEKAKEFADAKALAGQLRVSDVVTMMPPSLWKEYFPKTLEGLDIGTEQLTKAYTTIENAIAEVGNQLNVSRDNRNWEVNDLSRVSVRQFFPKLMEELAGQKGSANTILDKTLRDEIALIENGKGLYQLRKDASGKPLYNKQFGFTYYDGLEENQFLNTIQDTLIEDPSAVTKKGFFGNDVQAIIDWSEGRGELPQSLSVAYDALPNKSFRAISNDVRISEGKKPLDFRGIEKVETIVAPEYQKDLHNKPSLHKTINAVRQSFEKYGNPDVGDQIILEGLFDKEAYLYNPENAYVVFKGPDGAGITTNYFNKLGTEMTVNDVIGATGSNMMTSFGAFDLTKQDLDRAITRGEIDYMTLLSEPVQRMIFRNKISEETSKIYPDNSDYAMPGMGREYAEFKGVKTIEAREDLINFVASQFADSGFNFNQLSDNALNEINRLLKNNE
tara:strand:- start:4054 stop:6819 length:2766 start_codon:yes stop_codon:yes gene_type:complete